MAYNGNDVITDLKDLSVYQLGLTVSLCDFMLVDVTGVLCMCLRVSF